MSNTSNDKFVRVGTLKDLQARGVLVVAHGADRPIAVFAHEGGISAVDNRCPHMGFPLHRGTVKDGILTCPWHHARFDLCSGCTFDLFADDVPAYDVEVREGDVYACTTPRRGLDREHLLRRLRQGMEQNISLVQAKSVVGLLKSGVDYRDVVRESALFGARYRDGWGSGLTILTAMANLFPGLDEETAYLALGQGVRRVAGDCAGQPPRRDRYALEGADIRLETLKRWFRYWILVRHREAAERTLLTAVRSGASPAALSDLLFSAATDRFYADTGHVLDACNKAFEMLDLIGWEHAEAVLPAVVAQLASARGGEESNAWRHPVDLVPPLQKIGEELPGLLQEGSGRVWDREQALIASLLGENPLAILTALREAAAAGARPVQLAKVLAYVAAVRIAQFGPTNEFGDWITALHTFTYCNALHQTLKRSSSPEVARGIFHGAISVWLDRFLNVPPIPLPVETGGGAPEGRSAEDLCQQFLELLNRRQEVSHAASLVTRYLRLGHPVQNLFRVLVLSVVREDANFHTFQMIEAAVRQHGEWEGRPEAGHILIAAARYLAAHAPTERAQLQTATIALRLHRGEALYEANGEKQSS
ncbi:MAG: Rieske (2Fe-2S) protein [Planctomycetes bacterium]|nr:Rieske (2Fe-2S) protein [Planctomycetota bacterium]